VQSRCQHGRCEYAGASFERERTPDLVRRTKDSSHQLFLSDAVREGLGAPQPDDLLLVGDIRLRGCRDPLRVWTLAER